MRERDRRIIVWPWDVSSEVISERLTTVAVANPAVESVWLRDASGAERSASPQEAHDAASVVGVDLVVRVIASATSDDPEMVVSPRAVAGTANVVLDRYRRDAVDQSDPRLILPADGSGLRLPSISHLRRVRLDATGALRDVGPVVLPDTTRYEIYGKEDPGVTWLDGQPWLTYVGVSDWGVTPMLARGAWTSDGWVYERVGAAQGHHDNRDVKILPVRPGGKLWRHDRVNTLPWGPKRMTWAVSPDNGLSWSSSQPLMEGRFDWEKRHVGSGAVPFLCDGPDGRQVLASYYHGVHPEAGAVAGCYQTGLALFDAASPEVLVGRSPDPVLSAWANADFEAARQAASPLDEVAFAARHGLFVVPRVVFTTGHVRVGDAQWLFSGVNDFCLERAVLPAIGEMMADIAR